MFPAIGLVTKEEEEVENRNRNRNWGCLLIKKQLNQTFYMRRELLVLLTACQVRCGKMFFMVSIIIVSIKK